MEKEEVNKILRDLKAENRKNPNQSREELIKFLGLLIGAEDWILIAAKFADFVDSLQEKI